jgi:hypothetical protein
VEATATWQKADTRYTGSFAVAAVPEAEQVGAPGSGDLDGDGAITAAEAVIVAQAVISGGAGFTPAQIAAADIDGDGILTMADAVKLVRKMMGLL